MSVILPKTLIRSDEVVSQPFFFLAGPVLGGGDWQHTMYQALAERLGEDNFVAAIPCRYENNHPLVARQLSGGEFFSRQLLWERHYLAVAAQSPCLRSCIVFWLPCESKTCPRTDGQSYARDTRGELGEWRGRMMHDKAIRLVIGAEPDFPGLNQIQENFKRALGVPSFTIYNSIPEVVQRASEIVLV